MRDRWRARDGLLAAAARACVAQRASIVTLRTSHAAVRNARARSLRCTPLASRIALQDHSLAGTQKGKLAMRLPVGLMSGLLALGPLLAAPAPAQAQIWPSRNIR